MSVISDFKFKDGHKISDYNIEVSELYPCTPVIKNNTLIINTGVIGTELIIHVKGEWKPLTKVSMLFKNAQGKAYINSRFSIDNSTPQDSQGTVYLQPSSDDESGFVFLVSYESHFQFTGYTITTI